MRLLTIAALAAGIFSISAPVLAADLIQTPPAVAVPEADAFSWTGLYVGANAGYSWGTSNSAFTSTSAPFAGTNINSSPAGFIGGVQAGYNYQTGVLVLGVEAEASVSNITASFADPLSPGDTVTAGSDYSGALLAKVGLGLDHFMPYLVGGVAAAHVYSNDTAPDANDSGIFTGWAAGAGVEYAVDDNWSIGTQYLHSSLTGPTFNASHAWASTANPVNDTVTARINYKF